jgi:arsenite methyltransferase
MGSSNVEFREGILEKLPIEDAWADVVISNGVINLCADKRRAFSEIWRVLKSGGHLQFADIACQHRSLGRLNCRWSAVRSLAKNDRG